MGLMFTNPIFQPWGTSMCMKNDRRIPVYHECTGCHIVSYCCRKHQKEAWPTHKLWCYLSRLVGSNVSRIMQACTWRDDTKSFFTDEYDPSPSKFPDINFSTRGPGTVIAVRVSLGPGFVLVHMGNEWVQMGAYFPKMKSVNEWILWRILRNLCEKGVTPETQRLVFAVWGDTTTTTKVGQKVTIRAVVEFKVNMKSLKSFLRFLISKQ